MKVVILKIHQTNREQEEERENVQQKLYNMTLQAYTAELATTSLSLRD